MNAEKHPASPAPLRELDVRPIVASGGAPIGAILDAVAALPPGGALRLVAPFEPVPLYAKLGDMGYGHASRVRGDGAWEILFTRRAPAMPEPVMLDLRSLEPPQPMLTVLETLATLPPGASLLARTRFRPVHLHAVLEQRGLACDSQPQPDGSWETLVTVPAADAAASPSEARADQP